MDPVKAALDRYYDQIIKQYGWIRIFGQTTPKPLREVFTDVYVLDKPTAMRRFDPKALRGHLWNEDRSVPFRYEERLPAEQLLGRGSKFFILGKPGAGKTTLLKHLAVREAQRGKWGSHLGKIPIFVPLKQFAESGKPLFDFIVEQFAVCHFQDAGPFVERLLKAGKALVLFDGLDEVTRDVEARSDRRGQVTEQIEQFARQYDGCHIVVTCRIAATEYMLDPAFLYLELADFAPDQVEAFVRNWFWDPEEPDRSVGLAKRMLTEWAKPEHEGLRDLGRSPLLLTLLCLNYVEALRFPVRRVEIYQEALGALLKKWDASRQIQRTSLYRTLSLGRKQQMFSHIAYDNFLHDEILFAQADLEGQLKAYLAHLPEAPAAIDIDTEAVLREIVEQHGILAEQARRLFSFAHLAFQEYYVAQYLVENLAPDTCKPLMARFSRRQMARGILAHRRDDARRHPFPGRIREGVAAPDCPFARVWSLGCAGLTRRRRRLRPTTGGLPRARYYCADELGCKVAGELAVKLDRELGLDERDNSVISFCTHLLGVWEDFFNTGHTDRVKNRDYVKSSGHYRDLRRYERLQREAEARAGRLEINEEDRQVLTEYANASRLFFDCLQLAYTPDRRAFEDRILLPPPPNEQEA